MIKVQEILDLSLFSNFKVLCGKDYLSNTVTATVILEYESSRINYKGYCYGYFVLLSYFFASKDPELVHNTLRNLIEKKVSAIAIKMLPTETIPTDIVQLARENHVPLLIFHEEFMEDLIININESMKTRAQYVIMEEKLNTLLENKLSPEGVHNTALEINEDFQPYIYTAHITSKKKMDNLSIHSYFDKLMYRQYREIDTSAYSYIKYQMGLILICSFPENSLPIDSTFITNHLNNLLTASGFLPDDFYIGISNEILPLEQLNISVQKAINANFICSYERSTIKHYTDLGVYKYIITLLQDPILYQDIEKDITILQQYDMEHDSNLLETLIVYVRNNGEYKTTANEMFQHTNTIRYRIRKAEQLLSMKEDTAYEEILFLIQSYLLHSNL